MTEIIDEIMKYLPEPKKISDTSFEGANIVLYTKDKDFFLDDKGCIRDAVNMIKKRIELRPDPAITLDVEDAEKIIKKVIPEEAAIDKITFDPQRSRVIIETEKPGVAIGKQGELLREIKKQTLWVPIVRRSPVLRSKIIENIRAVLYQYSDYRRKFLDKVGHRIYDGWKRGKQDEWIRVTFLGGARQVGRSCVFLQTPESRVLLDCGVNVAASDQNQFPHLDAPEFKLEELDAVILSHAHLDHGGLIPWLFKMGYRGPVYCSVDYAEPTIIKENGIVKIVPIGKLCDLLIEKAEDVEKLPKNNYVCADVLNKIEVPAFDENYKISFKPLKRVIRHDITDDLYQIKLKTGRSVKVTGSHSIFTIRDGEVKETKVKDLSVDDYVVVPHRLPIVQSTNEIDLAEIFKGNEYIKSEDCVSLKQGHKIPLRINISKELMRILGYFAAEGSLDKRSIAFDFGLKDRLIIKDLIWSVKKVFGISAKERVYGETRIRVTVNSRLVRELFANLFFAGYKNAKSKRVPEVVFNTSVTNKINFLKAYFDGDGYLNIINKTIDAISVSKDLISDLSYILSQIGITYTLFSRKIKSAFTKNMVYRIAINLSEFMNKNVLRVNKSSCDLIPLNKVRFDDGWYYHKFKTRHHVTKGRLNELIKKDWLVIRDGNSLLIKEILQKLVNSDLSFLPIVSIKKVKPTKNSVYDFSVEGNQNFIAGNAPVCLHNTAPTRDVAALLALDFIGVAAKESKKGLFSSTDVKEMVKHTICLDYEEVTDITPDIRITFYNAGHVLGSALTHLHIGNGLHNLLYSGDMKGIRTRLLEPAATRFPRLETAIIEATYGAKTDIVKSRKECEDEMLGIIKTAIDKGGKILIPVLGVGRAQEIVVIIEEAVRTGKIPKVPVFVQGLVWDVTAIHTAYPDFLSNAIRKQTFHKDQNPFLSDYLKRIASRKEQEEVINETGSCVIIATSGMMTAGASVAYFKALAEDPRNAIIFVSYLGEGTLGRKIQSGEKQVLIPNEKPEPIAVKLAVHSIPGMTGHAARDELMRYVHSLEPKPKKVIVNHGESSKCLDLASSIHKIERIETNAPKNLETIRVR